MRRITLLTVVCTFAVLSGLMIRSLLPSAFTQEGPSEHSSSAQGRSVSEQELKAFAKVYVEYQKLQREYEPSLRTAQDTNEKTKIQREANSKLEKVLDRQGLTPEKYNRIFQAVNNDAELRKKGLDMIKEERAKP